MNCAKTAEPIKMLFGLWTQMGPRKHLLNGGPDPLAKRQFLGGRTCPGFAKMAELIKMPFGLWTGVAQETMYWMGIQISPWKEAMLKGKACPDMPDDTLM